MKKIICALMAITMLFSLTACGGKDSQAAQNPSSTAATDTGEPLIIKIGTQDYPGSPDEKIYNYFVDLISERSEGKIQIAIYNQSQLGTESELLQQVMDGTLPGAAVGIGAFTKYTDLLSCIQLPFLVDSYELEPQAVNSDIYQGLLEEVGQQLGVTFGLFQDPGMRQFGMINKPITCLKDLSNVKIRCAENELTLATMTAIGASPTAIPFTELYTALQNKIVDGEDINMSSIYTQHHDEVIKYVSEINLYPYTGCYVFNADFVNSLPEGYWDIIYTAMKEAEELNYTQWMHEQESVWSDSIKANGVAINTIDDNSEFVEAVQPVYDSYIAKDARIGEFIDYINSQK